MIFGIVSVNCALCPVDIHTDMLEHWGMLSNLMSLLSYYW